MNEPNPDPTHIAGKPIADTELFFGDDDLDTELALDGDTEPLTLSSDGLERIEVHAGGTLVVNQVMPGGPSEADAAAKYEQGYRQACADIERELRALSGDAIFKMARPMLSLRDDPTYNAIAAACDWVFNGARPTK